MRLDVCPVLLFLNATILLLILEHGWSQFSVRLLLCDNPHLTGLLGGFQVNTHYWRYSTHYLYFAEKEHQRHRSVQL